MPSSRGSSQPRDRTLVSCIAGGFFTAEPPGKHLYQFFQFSSVQFSHSVVSDSATPWIAAHQASLSITNSQSSLKLMCIESVMSSSHLILCHPLLFLPPISPSIRAFSNESTLRMAKSTGVSASASVLPMNTQDWSPLGWTGWISLQSKELSRVFSSTSSKASILWCSAFFTVQLSHPYMTTGKTIALTRRTFVGKVMSLLFNMLSRLLITFLPRKVNFMASITICSDFGAQKNKVWYCFHCFPIYFPWSDGTRCHDLSFLNVEF